MPTNNKNNFDLTKPLNYTERSIMARNLDMIERQRYSSSSYDQKKALKEQEESQKRINQAREASERRLAQEREAAERRMNQEREAAERRISQEQEQRTRRELELQEQYARRAAAIERQNAEEQLAYEQEYRRKQMAVSYTEYDPENELYYYYDHKGDYIDTIEARLRWQTINCKSYTTYDPDDEFWQYFLDKEGEVIPRDEARKLWELENCPDFKDFDPEGNWTMYRLGDGYISREEALEKWKAENADSPEVKRLNCEKIVYTIKKILLNGTVRFPSEWNHEMKANTPESENLKKLSLEYSDTKRLADGCLYGIYALSGFFGIILMAAIVGLGEEMGAGVGGLIVLDLVLIVIMIFWHSALNKKLESIMSRKNEEMRIIKNNLEENNSENESILEELNKLLEVADEPYITDDMISDISKNDEKQLEYIRINDLDLWAYINYLHTPEVLDHYTRKKELENDTEFFKYFGDVYNHYDPVLKFIQRVSKYLPEHNCTLLDYYEVSCVLPIDVMSIKANKPLIDFCLKYNYAINQHSFPNNEDEIKTIIEAVDHMTENDIKKGLSATISYITAKGAEQIKEKLAEAGISSTIT